MGLILDLIYFDVNKVNKKLSNRQLNTDQIPIIICGAPYLFIKGRLFRKHFTIVLVTFLLF